MFVDLSVPINVRTPVYPGDPATKIEPVGVIEKDGYTDHFISIATHVGTHIDAPLHMVADGKTLDQFELSRFVGNGRLIEVKDNTFSLETVEQANVEAGDIVLFHTGWGDRYHEAVYFEDYPALPEDIAKYLVEKQVSMVGFDMCGPDHEPFPIHKILLGGNVLIIENLTNLDKLIGKDFTVTALPIKLEVDGAPARVIAQIQP